MSSAQVFELSLLDRNEVLQLSIIELGHKRNLNYQSVAEVNALSHYVRSEAIIESNVVLDLALIGCQVALNTIETFSVVQGRPPFAW